MGYGDKMNKMALIAGVIVAVVVIAAVGYFVISGSGGNNPETELSANINGSDYTYAEMKDQFGTKTVDSKEGIPLSAIVNDTGLANPGTFAFVLKSDDGYAMAVNWSVMQNGIVTLVTETDEETGNETSYLMTVFPNMPSAYKVKNLANIEKAELTPIVLNGLEYYLDYMPKRVEDKTVTFNETYAPTGWSLSDMVNYTGLADQAAHNYTIYGSDGYNKTITWYGMMGGVLVEDGVKTVFASSTEFARNKYVIKNVVKIIVE
jgi:hypothetical protein